METPHRLFIVEERHQRYTKNIWRYVAPFGSMDLAVGEAKRRKDCGYELRIISYSRGSELVGWDAE